MPLFRKTHLYFCSASTNGDHNRENNRSHETHLYEFHAKDVILLLLPVCLHCSAALEDGTFPLGLSRNIMSHVACDPALTALLSVKKAEKWRRKVLPVMEDVKKRLQKI